MSVNAPRHYEMLQQEFMRLHGLGWTFRRIAESLGISERTVTAWREELDLPRRPRGRRPRRLAGKYLEVCRGRSDTTFAGG